MKKIIRQEVYKVGNLVLLIIILMRKLYMLLSIKTSNALLVVLKVVSKYLIRYHLNIVINEVSKKIIFNNILELDGGIGIVEMMFRTNILALVGGGQRPKFAPTKVFLWDDLSFKCIGELSFKTQVRAVKLTKEK